MNPSAPHPLLAALVDYAGLYPPAALDMATAVANYARYRVGPHRNLLGRFVIGVSDLDALGVQAWLPREPGSEPWELAVVVGEAWRAAPSRVEAFDDAHRDPAAGRAAVTALELRPSAQDEIVAMAGAFGDARPIYYEVPLDREPAPWLEAIHSSRGFAKARLGGVTTQAIPKVEDVARFLRRCHELTVPFKATAGLHHLLRAEYPLTYEPDGPRGILFGFLNVFTAAALGRRFDLSEEDLAAVLSERELDAWRWTGQGLAWKDLELTATELGEIRRGFAHSFGSCSFEEPVDELTKAGLP